MTRKKTNNTSPVTDYFSDIVSNGSNTEENLVTNDGFSIHISDIENFHQTFACSEQETPLVFLLSGTSESGKSHFGEFLREHGIATRIKILRLVRELIVERKLPYREYENEPLLFLDHLSPNERKKYGQIIVEELCTKLDQLGTPISTIETISHPWLIEEFRNYKQVRQVSIFIDAPLRLRVEREAERTNSPFERTKKIVVNKDNLKDSFGSRKIHEIADLVVSNVGSIQTYTDFVLTLGKLAKESTIKRSGLPIMYS